MSKHYKAAYMLMHRWKFILLMTFNYCELLLFHHVMLCGGLSLSAPWGTFFFVRCDELSDFAPPFRLKVQHIPGCTGQYDFNLFSQAAQTQTLRHNRAWNSCTTSLAETFSLFLWTKLRGKSRVASASCVPHVLTVKTCGPGFVKLRKWF